MHLLSILSLGIASFQIVKGLYIGSCDPSAATICSTSSLNAGKCVSSSTNPPHCSSTCNSSSLWNIACLTSSSTTTTAPSTTTTTCDINYANTCTTDQLNYGMCVSQFGYCGVDVVGATPVFCTSSSLYTISCLYTTPTSSVSSPTPSTSSQSTIPSLTTSVVININGNINNTQIIGQCEAAHSSTCSPLELATNYCVSVSGYCGTSIDYCSPTSLYSGACANITGLTANGDIQYSTPCSDSTSCESGQICGTNGLCFLAIVNNNSNNNNNNNNDPFSSSNILIISLSIVIPLLSIIIISIVYNKMKSNGGGSSSKSMIKAKTKKAPIVQRFDENLEVVDSKTPKIRKMMDGEGEYQGRIDEQDVQIEEVSGTLVSPNLKQSLFYKFHNSETPKKSAMI